MSEGLYFIVKRKTHSETKTPCVFSISKKTFKTAVLRNKIKRQIKDILRKTNKTNERALIIPKKEIVNASFVEIEKDLLSVL